jgi:hypothetical protein
MHDEQFDLTDDDRAEDRTDEDNAEAGKAGWALLWLLGIPLPVLLIAYLVVRGC